MKRTIIAIAGTAALALLGVSGSASAQAAPDQTATPPPEPYAQPQPYAPPQEYPPAYPEPQAYPPAQPPPPAAAPAPSPYQTRKEKRRAKFSKYETSLSVGGGVADFWRDRISGPSSISGAWDARLMFGTRSPFAFEATYLGTAAQAHDPLNSPTLGTTQVYGNLRMNLTTWRFQPFLTAGAGWVNMHRYGSNEASPVAASTYAKNVNAVVVPMGGGISTYLGQHFLLDGRFTYHLIANKSFTDTGARPDMWVAELRAGFAF